MPRTGKKRGRGNLSRLTSWGAAAFFVGSGTQAQVVEIPDELSCAACRIEVEQLMRIGGDPADPVPIGYSPTLPLDSRGRVFYAASDFPGSIGVYRVGEGRIGELGRSGEGPGEYSATTSIFLARADSLYVFDRGNARLTVLDPDLSLARTSQVTMIPNAGFVRDDGGMIISMIGRSADSFGFTVHELSPEGAYLRSFGPDLSGVSGERLALLSREVGRSASGFWVAETLNYRLTHYSNDLQPTIELVRRPEWFPERTDPPVVPRNPRAPAPFSVIYGVQEDSAGLLWILSWVAAEDWVARLGDLRDNAPTATTLWDTMLEVLDPSAGRVVARRRLDGRALGFSGPGVIYDHENVELYPTITMWRIRLAPPPSPHRR